MQYLVAQKNRSKTYAPPKDERYKPIGWYWCLLAAR